MFPITKEMCEKAYEAKKLKPTNGLWVDDDGECACPLGALIAQRHGMGDLAKIQKINSDDSVTLARIRVAALLGLTYDQVDGFADGVDTYEFEDEIVTCLAREGEGETSAEYVEAFRAGHEMAVHFNLVESEQEEIEDAERF